jgi:two-component system response regulator NreC
MQVIKAILVDDHRIFRDGIVSLFSDTTAIKIIDVASNAEEALKKIAFSKPDIVILDISMPDASGIDIIDKIHEIDENIKVLILSMHTSEDYVFKAIRAGASGYLAKQNTSKTELINAIQQINEGYEYFSESISRVMQSHFVKKARRVDQDVQDKYRLLSNREKELLKLVLEGLSNQEIASRLFVNIRTVETHKTNILQKLDVRNSVELVKYAIKNNLMEL